MSFQEVPAESDLWVPLPGPGEQWDDHTIHTHYFGFSEPQNSIGVFIYIRYMPVFKLIQGGVCIFKGKDNLKALDCEHCNFLNTMPYPETVNNLLKDNVVQTKNGLRVEFIEPGRKVRIQYESPDGRTSFDVLQTAITPLLPRGHVMPGENLHTDPTQKPGGSEQFMHCTGTMTVNGKVFDKIDCYPVRDRSWRQVRTEAEVDFPPVGWSPMAFGPDLQFNQVGYDSSPQNWRGLFKVDPSRPVHYFAWVVNQGEVRNVSKVKRDIIKIHPELFIATEQVIEAEDDKGEKYTFRGEAVAIAHLPSWPNNIFMDSLYKWTDDQGRVSYCAYQEAFYHKYYRFCRGKLEHSG